ncbi:protein YebE [Pseudovibrio japonicus]|uniref:Protein YebE n=1 Tax=Pseudovibrio japonicus TaxID=366534 RepID=A0ABQ3EJD5_9HYPH|nr:tellurite resistance TerB family protein [Pseudovibrio japonicus]GHB37516.1 protein YebE [Pseudovibrio japonicus]
MFDSKALLDQFLGSNGGNQARGALDKGQSYVKNNAGGLAGGAVAGGLAGYLLGSKKGKKLGKKAVKYGGMALVGGLAYKAFQTWQSNQNNGGSGGTAAPQGSAETQTQSARATVMPVPEPLALPDPTGTAFDPDTGNGDGKEFAMALITAMIQAAKADGNVDGVEMQRIFEKLDELGLGAEEKAFVLDEMRAPLDIDRVVAFATCPETAAEIYTASRLAIDPNTAAERAYLMMLAARLELDSGLVAELDKAIAAAQAQA